MFKVESKDESVIFVSEKNRLRLCFVTETIVRITFTEDRPFQTRPSRIVTTQKTFTGFHLAEDTEAFSVSTSSIKVLVNKRYGSILITDRTGKTLVREPEFGGKWLTPKDVYRNVFNKGTSIQADQNIDGARADAVDFKTIFDRQAFEAKLEFVFAEDEALFGLGSHEEGFGNLRGKARELYQQNMKAVVPHFVSTRGYSVLLDCCSLMTFHDDALGSYWWADVVDELDYYVMQGDTFDDLMKNYRELTGPAPMLPKWAFGYIQSKERYVTGQELLDVAHEYRRRQIPLDAIVLDWKSWPNGLGWGQKSLDPLRFPDPEGLLQKLHALHVKLMISIWPIMLGECPNQIELREHNFMLGNQSTYNPFLPAARECYWQQVEHGLFAHGVDAWWCDCTEPFEADWAGAAKPEPHTRLAINTQQSKRYLDPGDLNAYSLLHSQGIYEGQRSATHSKRVLNLTRSSYVGQHRYGTITWNGDICATWDSLRRCIPEGVNFCATGESYWTVDIGGFFINHDPKFWFWRGDYRSGCRGLTDANAVEPDPRDTGCSDLGFWELYVRWVQYAAFLPMFRSHGTDAAREIWRFGEEGTLFYEVIAKYIRLRYELLPYIYSLAAQVTLSGSAMMRALALDFPEDSATYGITDQFLMGSALLVCPVTKPMYYAANSKPLQTSKERPVYLPDGCTWYNFWDQSSFQGGRTVLADAPLNTIPVYVRAGSIVPMAQTMQYTDEVSNAVYRIHIYCGADGEFQLYEDAGDSYDYECGASAVVRMKWYDVSKTLTIFKRIGHFPEMVVEREYLIVLISGYGSLTRSVLYIGEEVIIEINDFSDEQSWGSLDPSQGQGET